MKYIIILFLINISILNADFNIKIIQNDKRIKSFDFSNEQLKEYSSTEYFQKVKYLKEDENKSIIISEFKYGIKFKIKKEKENYKIKIFYIFIDRNFSNEIIKINEFQTFKKFLPMRENNNNYDLIIKNKNQKTIIELGREYKIVLVEK